MEQGTTGLSSQQWLEVLKTKDADVSYLGGFLAGEEADRALSAAAQEQYVQEQIRIHGRTHDIPRLTMWYSEDGSRYTYSGGLIEPHPDGPSFHARDAER